MTSHSDIARFWRQQYLQKTVLAVMPIVAAVAHGIGASDLLVFGAIVPPIAILLGNVLFLGVSDLAPRIDRRGSSAMVQYLDERLGEVTEGQAGCVLIEIEDQETLERDWGTQTLQLVQGEVVARICAMLRQTDNVFLMKDGTIGLAIADIRLPALNSLISLVERLQEGIGHPIAVDAAEVHVEVCVGLCLQNRAPLATGTSMHKSAELALTEARRIGNGAVRAFSNLTPKATLDTEAVARDVTQALASGQIVPWFQPQISTDTGQVTGFEALARWTHPEQGPIPPSEFIPLLERAGKMEELGETILNHALRALASWDKSGFDVPTVSVNFGTEELRNPSLVERIKWDVDRFELEPRRLTVEILETVISETEDDVVTRNIRELGSQGFNIDLDDFGTGHATLANIRRFEVDRIKIDRSFVVRADEDPAQQRMVAAIVGMAERLEIETLAEGVETIGEQSILSQLGCTHLQGFGIARPMPFDDTLGWLADRRAKLKSPPLLNRRTG